MTIKTGLVNSIWKKVGSGCLLFFLIAPVFSTAQQAPASSQSLDAWRAPMNEQLDRYLSDLVQEAQPGGVPLIRAERNKATVPSAEASAITSKPAGSVGPFAQSVDEILRLKGLPAQLISVVSVESGFKPWALSPKGALGLWQLMPETARRYGLVVNGARDDRRDPAKSTAAAAQYLKDLYGQFGSWPLALAAYNAGEVRVQNAIDRFQTRDFWTLSAKLALPDETRRYVPAVLLKAGGEEGLAVPAPPLMPSLKPLSKIDGHSLVVFATTAQALLLGQNSN